MVATLFAWIFLCPTYTVVFAASVTGSAFIRTLRCYWENKKNKIVVKFQLIVCGVLQATFDGSGGSASISRAWCACRGGSHHRPARVPNDAARAAGSSARASPSAPTPRSGWATDWPPSPLPARYCIVSSQTSLHLFSWKLVSRNGFESRKTVFSLLKSLVLNKSFLQTFWFASLKKVLNSFHIKFRKGFSGKIYSMFNIFIQPIWIMAWWHLLADFIKSFDIWIWSPNTSPMLTVGY